MDRWQKCSNIQILEETQDLVSIRYTFTAPAMPGLKAAVTYTVDCNHMEVNVHYFGDAGRPQLPLFGLRFATSAPVETVEWIGLSGETYPDRKKGGLFENTGKCPIFPTIWCLRSAAAIWTPIKRCFTGQIVY